jgi:hypothetical protein
LVVKRIVGFKKAFRRGTRLVYREEHAALV